MAAGANVKQKGAAPDSGDAEGAAPEKPSRLRDMLARLRRALGREVKKGEAEPSRPWPIYDEE